MFVAPLEPALNDTLPLSLTMSLIKGTVVVALAVTPVESNIAFAVCTVPPFVDAAVIPPNVTKELAVFRSDIVVLEAYNGVKNPLAVDI